MKRLSVTICLTIAVLLGSAGVSWSADFQKGMTAFEVKDYATALREWEPLAEQGDVDAQFYLGLMYDWGYGVPQDDKTAMKWFRLSAEQWEPLAEQGDADAQLSLGWMYAAGYGVPQDDKTALKWYRLSAEQGNADAQYDLGRKYLNGIGVPQDTKTALKWYRLAAEQGDADAQYNLGILYDDGYLVPQDYKTALKWYRLAAEQGHAYAQHYIEELLKHAPDLRNAQVNEIDVEVNETTVNEKVAETLENSLENDLPTSQTHSADIIAVIPDGRTVVLHDDGTWETLKSADIGKIVFSAVSLVPTKDEHGYDMCEVTIEARNMTKFIIPNLISSLYVYGKDGLLDGLEFMAGNFLLGDTIENYDRLADGNCKDIVRIDIAYNPMFQITKRSIKNMKFETDEEAGMFVKNLLGIASDHDHGIVKLRIYNLLTD